MSNFEERLLGELRTLVADEPAERRQPRRLWQRQRLVLAGGLAALVSRLRAQACSSSPQARSRRTP